MSCPDLSPWYPYLLAASCLALLFTLLVYLSVSQLRRSAPGLIKASMAISLLAAYSLLATEQLSQLDTVDDHHLCVAIGTAFVLS